MNYYDRENYKWYDPIIQNIIYKISRNKHINSSDFYYMTNLDTTTTTTLYGDYYIQLGNNQPLKIILSIIVVGDFDLYYSLSISSFHKNGDMFDFYFGKENMKNHYDGTSIITVDINNEDVDKGISVINWDPDVFYFNNVTIEYKEEFLSYDYNLYKSEILKEIS